MPRRPDSLNQPLPKDITFRKVKDLYDKNPNYSKIGKELNISYSKARGILLGSIVLEDSPALFKEKKLKKITSEEKPIETKQEEKKTYAEVLNNTNQLINNEKLYIAKDKIVIILPKNMTYKQLEVIVNMENALKCFVESLTLDIDQ